MASRSIEITSRQIREIEYHKHHAEKLRLRRTSISYDILHSHRRRWWNAYWSMYDIVLGQNLRGKTALVVGCGAGADAIYLAKLGAEVHAFDLSPDMISLAGDQAESEGVQVDFRIMSAEMLLYPASMFDVILVRDILHHCEVDSVVQQLSKVAKRDGQVIINELYTHSALQAFRDSTLGKWLQSKLVPIIYGGKEPYITIDERKLDEQQLRTLQKFVNRGDCAYFNMFVNRFLPEHWTLANKWDRRTMRVFGSLGYLLAGRFLLWGMIRNE